MKGYLSVRSLAICVLTIIMITNALRSPGWLRGSTGVDGGSIFDYTVVLLLLCLLAFIMAVLYIRNGPRWTIILKGDSSYDYLVLDQDQRAVAGSKAGLVDGMLKVTINGPDAISLQVFSYSPEGTNVEASISRNGEMVAQAKEYIRYALGIWSKTKHGMEMMKLNSPGYKSDG